MDFLELVAFHAEKHRDNQLFSDGMGVDLTYGESWDISSRVYAYLKSRGIGKEEFVLVCLPRGAYPFVAALGILRAGAAFVLVEDEVPAERIAYIRMDCGCKLVIDQPCFEEILKTEPLEDFEPRELHSAAFAVYTSGTTGRPKGVLHEYGNIDRIIRSNPFVFEDDRLALCSPLNFVFSVVSMFCFLAEAQQCYIVPFDTIKDPAKFHAFLLENRITLSFLTPLFVKKMAPFLMTLKTCAVGSEPANDLYVEGLDILNGYTMSEVGFIVSSFRIDKPYSNTPVGSSPCGFPIYVMDEEGNIVPEGEKGEIVLENPYVRGYINMPEKTAEVFKDGLYHTGDLGMWEKTNRLVVCGRLDDMEKVNGNRIEPAEIEAAAREELGLSWTGVKVFHGDAGPVICLYYIDPIEIDINQAQKTLEARLPYYMIPSFFMHIDQIPFTLAGKFNRNALPKPDLDASRPEIVAPENEIQAALCQAFAKVFQMAEIGINDDFFRLGGDSLNAMEVVADSGLDGLSVTDLFAGRTPKQIAVLYESHKTSENPDEINDRALTKDFPLTANQAYTVLEQLKEPDSVMRSIHTLMKFDKNIIDMQRMANAISAAARNHPALFTEVFCGDDGAFRQRFSPELLEEIRVEHLTEAEFEGVKSTLVKPFTMINAPLFRARVFETESAGYVFADVHHIIFDGASYDILFSSIMSAYIGKELTKDYYPYILEKQLVQNATSGNENEKYFDETYGKTDWCRHLTITGEARDSVVGVRNETLPVTLEKLASLEKQKGISKNAFFIITAAIALAKCEMNPDVMLFWTFDGRTDAKEAHSVGNLRCTLPAAFSFAEGASFEELCNSVRTQINAGIAHCRYPYLETHPEMLDDGVTRVLYQGTLGSFRGTPGFLGIIPLAQVNTVSRAFVNLEISEHGNDVVMTVKYTKNCFETEKIEAFIKTFFSTIKLKSL